MRLLLAAVIALALLAAPAVAQDNPFDLPPAQPVPEPTPTPEPVDEDDGVGVTTLYVIAGGLLIAFLAIGVWISRDARRSLPAGSRTPAGARGGLAPDGEGERVRSPRQAKAAARARGRAQRAARRRNR